MSVAALIRRLVPPSALLALLLASPSALAFELEQIEVLHTPPRYEVSMQVRLNTPAQAAFSVFSDITLLPQINPAIRKAKVLGELPDNVRRVYTQVHLCVALFCKQIEQVQDMRFESTNEGARVQAQVLPELSDLRFGEAHWTFRSCGAQTCLTFHTRMEPKFWVPPLIGPWLIQRKLKTEAMETSAGLERLARTHQQRNTP